MLLAFLWSSIAKGQQYCNEWINFSSNQQYSNQQYFKVSVWRDGVYRITYADLQAAAFPLPFNPKQLQLFYQGSEHLFGWKVKQMVHLMLPTTSNFMERKMMEVLIPVCTTIPIIS